MSIACVIGTAALAEHASRTLSSGGQPYSNRAWLLRNVILPWYVSAGTFSEIVVVGEFEPGPGYTHIPFNSVYKNCADALVKRQAGWDALKHKNVEWILFQHDDHLYDPSNPYPAHDAAGVLSPSRFTRARCTQGEALNDGSGVGPNALVHVNGHVCLMRHSVLENGFAWTQSPPLFTWDVEVTHLLRQRNVPIRYAPELVTWDMEAGAEPWK